MQSLSRILLESMGLLFEMKDGLESKRGRQQKSWQRDLLQWTAVATVSFVLFAFVFPKHPVTGGAVSVSVIGTTFAARACWGQRHHFGFWLTLVVISFAQGMVIVLAPWHEIRFPGIVLLPIGLADFAVVYGLLRVSRSLRFRKSETAPKG